MPRGRLQRSALKRASASEINAVMPAFGEVLSERELAAVSVFQRVEYGGEELDTALADCGFVVDS